MDIVLASSILLLCAPYHLMSSLYPGLTSKCPAGPAVPLRSLRDACLPEAGGNFVLHFLRP